MQLFTFGHPCEHQLRRVCIGGTSCPLNGYPDHWCCSFVKGRINFKRDKPCEGPRCRWGFAHPPSSSFDAVTLVLQEARACALKMEEGYGTGTLQGGPYVITSPNVADVAHCALNFLRVPPARVATRIGGLLAFAAIKAGDAKIFTQLLKTVKKPVDDYLIGAFEFLQSASKSGKGSATKDAVIDDLRHDVITIMGSALSQQGALVARPEQLPLQSYYIAALKTATRNKKKFVEALEQAAALYPDAIENLVIPDSFAKAGRRGESGDVTPSGGASEGGKTPDLKPHTPAAVTPVKAAQDAAPSAVAADSTATAPKSTTTTPGKAGAPALQPLPPPLAASPKLPPASSVPEPMASKKQSAAAAAGVIGPQVAQASLLATCQAMGPCELFDPSVFPASSVDVKLPPSTRLLFGGLFSLDREVIAAMEMPEGGAFSASTSPTEAPLGAAIREAQSNQLWRRGPFFTGANMCTDAAARLAEVSAAAAALRMVDFVLDA